MIDKSVSVEVRLLDSGNVELTGDNSDFLGSLRNVLTGCDPGVFDVTVRIVDDVDDVDDCGKLTTDTKDACCETLQAVLFDMEREGVEYKTFANIAKRYFDALNAACGGELYKIIEDYEEDSCEEEE